MGTSVSLKKKVYLCYSYSNNMYIDLLCKKINKEGFQAIADGIEFMPGERILSVSESIIKCDYYVLIISDEFSQHMREEYHTALKYEKNVMVFIKSELYRDEKINKEFKDRLVTLWDNETELSMKIIETMVGLRYKYPERGYQLEVLVEDLFKSYGCVTRRTVYTQDSNYDIYAEKDGKKFYIEVRAVRSRIISKSSIANTIVVSDLMSLKNDEYFVLVTANMIPDLIKEYVRTKDRFLVIDISALLYLVQDNEELKYRLLSLVEFTTEDIELKEQIYEEKAQIKGFPISDVSEAERHHAWIVEYEKRISKDANIYTILITNSKSIDEDTRIYAGNIYYVHREEYVSWAIKALTIIRSVWNMFTDEGDMEWRDPVHQQFIEEGITPKNYLDFVCKQNLRDIE